MSSYAPLTDTNTGRVSHWNATEAAAHVNARNIGARFRETFEAWPSEEWSSTVSGGDIITIDGNAMGASYLVISVDPLTAGTETFIDTIDSFKMPVEIAVGAHLSQQIWGSDCSIELIDREFVENVTDLEISSITQSTTTLTVDTVLPHGLAVGKRIGIKGCSNPLVNFPSITVATIPSPTRFTATGGPNSTITSQTVTNPAGAKGFVYFRPALSRSRNGTALHFEGNAATLGFFYARASAGDAIPFAAGSGNALNARQATTIGTTASVALAGTAPFTYSWVPTNEYRLTLMADRLQWSDVVIDSLAASTNRVLRSQVVPNPAKNYFLRLKATTDASATIPVGQIKSVSKSGSTTATVTMDRPHGLATGDLVVGYGVRDIGTGFYPSLTTAVAVTVTAPDTFTVVWGTSATNTSYGGFISKVNGSCPQGGALSQSIQSAVKTTLADGQHQIVLVGSANWAGVLIGDYVNIVGCRNIASLGETSVGIDGAWKVADVSTTNLTLVNIPGYSPVVSDFALVNCGGGVIKRTDFRVSYVRIFDFERLRVETLPRPGGDLAAAAPVNVLGAVISSGTVTTVTTSGTPLAPATPYFVNSAASTNGALVLTATSGLHAFWATNTGATAAFVKLYNKATAPTVGTDVPEMIIPVPAAVSGVPGVANIYTGHNAFRFPLGLGIAITGGAADADTTAVAAGQVKVKLSRTV
jgi:hypothetical protein